jgi:tol-pal system protein YbgF
MVAVLKRDLYTPKTVLDKSESRDCMNDKRIIKISKGKGLKHPLRFLPLFFLTLWALSISAIPSPAMSEQIVIDSDDQFQFAHQTLEKGEYQRAVVEFERFIHFFPENEKVPQARYYIGLAYLKGKRYEEARKVLDDVVETYPGRLIAGKALLLVGESYYEQGISEEAGTYFKRVIQEYPLPQLKSLATYRLGWSQMQANRWLEASETFKQVEQGSPLYPSALDLTEISLKGEQLSYKSPTTAGIMAIFPGLGHVYTKRYKDGMVALLLNGLTIWAAVEAFDQDLDVLGGLLTALEVGWYSGNIYSAVNSAHKYNRKVRDDFRRNLSARFNFEISSTKEVPLSLSLKIEF